MFKRKGINKIASFVLTFAMVLAGVGTFAGLKAMAAPTDVAIDEEHFPDAGFRSWILEQTYGSDGVLTAEEAAGVTVIYIENKHIADLTGIRYFTGLQTLHAQFNDFPRLDVSGLTNLNYVDAGFNPNLTDFNFSGCTSLAHLVINQASGVSVITSLDLSDCSNFYWLEDDGYSFINLKFNFARNGYGKVEVSNGGHGFIHLVRSNYAGTYANKIDVYEPFSLDTAYIFSRWKVEGEDVTMAKNGSEYTFTIGSQDAVITAIWKDSVTGEEIDPSGGSTDPDPLVYGLQVTNPVVMQWQGVSGDNISKAIGNVAISGSSQKFGRLTKTATVTVDPTSLPDGKSIKVSVPVKNIMLTIGGENIAATVSFDDVILDKTDGVTTLTATITTDRSDLPFDGYFKPVSGTAEVVVTEVS